MIAAWLIERTVLYKSTADTPATDVKDFAGIRLINLRLRNDGQMFWIAGALRNTTSEMTHHVARRAEVMLNDPIGGGNYSSTEFLAEVEKIRQEYGGFYL